MNNKSEIFHVATKKTFIKYENRNMLGVLRLNAKKINYKCEEKT